VVVVIVVVVVMVVVVVVIVVVVVVVVVIVVAVAALPSLCLRSSAPPSSPSPAPRSCPRPKTHDERTPQRKCVAWDHAVTKRSTNAGRQGSLLWGAQTFVFRCF